jgi:hypothetical protein
VFCSFLRAALWETGKQLLGSSSHNCFMPNVAARMLVMATKINADSCRDCFGAFNPPKGEERDRIRDTGTHYQDNALTLHVGTGISLREGSGGGEY